MKRWPLIASFLLFIALCACAAYWALQLFKPPVRPVAAPPRAAKTEVRPDAAAALFGGRTAKAAVASNYQLRGVVATSDGRGSVAILSAEGKPAQAIRIDREVMPGVTVKEVHRDYVLLSEGGVTKRVELPDSAKDQDSIATASPVRTQPSFTPPTSRPAPVPPPSVVSPPQRGQQGMMNNGGAAPPRNGFNGPAPSDTAPPANPPPSAEPAQGESSVPGTPGVPPPGAPPQ